MLYREIIDVCSEIHTKHINTLCGEKVEFLCMLSLVLHLYMLKMRTPFFQNITPSRRIIGSISCFERSGNDYPVMWSHVPEKGVLNQNSVQTTTVNGKIWVLELSLITYFLGLLNIEQNFKLLL